MCTVRLVRRAVLVVTLVLATAGSAAARTTGVIAPFNALGISRAEAARVQRWLAAAASAVPGHRWLASARLRRQLRRARQGDCAYRPECIGPMARRAGAQVVVVGDVGSLSGGFMLYLRLVDGDGKQLRAVNSVLQPDRPGLRRKLRALAYQLLAPGRYTGTVQVEVDVENAWIYLDGRRVARSPARALHGVSVGTHALRVTHEAYRDYVRFVDVPFGGTAEVKVGLSACPIKAGQMELSHRTAGEPLTSGEMPWYRRWWAVAAFGAVVMAAAATTVGIVSRRAVARDAEVAVGGP